MLNEDFPLPTRKAQDFLVETYKILGLPRCLSAAESAQFSGTKRLPECDAERAKEAAVQG